jgi:Predicted sugar kinase
MKLKIVAKNSQLVEPIISRIKDASKRLGITLVDEGEEVVMAVGGDGTLLKAIKLDKPVIAVKAGRRGFLMDVEPSEVEEALAKLLSGEYFREEYDLLRLRYHGRSLDAFNEVGVLYDEPESILLSWISWETTSLWRAMASLYPLPRDPPVGACRLQVYTS